MVTQPGREHLIQRSVECFNRQTFRPRELVIVHTGDSAFDRFIRDLTETGCDDAVLVVPASADHRLGELRNLSVAHAQHEFVSQWDDDDLHHPEFLERQHACLLEQDADFCFLTDQWHYFENRGFVFWDDWSSALAPMDLIEGTLFGSREKMPSYPDIAIGEDTPLVREIVQTGLKVARLPGMGSLLMYTWHGANAWNFEHHLAISQVRRIGEDALRARIGVIEAALAGYPLRTDRLRFPHDTGWLEFRRDDGVWRFTGNQQTRVSVSSTA
jgi:glycosyltransferase involved in cell wall biosynthesis